MPDGGEFFLVKDTLGLQLLDPGLSLRPGGTELTKLGVVFVELGFETVDVRHCLWVGREIDE